MLPIANKNNIQKAQKNKPAIKNNKTEKKNKQNKK
jgi:hypothetical protein